MCLIDDSNAGTLSNPYASLPDFLFFAAGIQGAGTHHLTEPVRFLDKSRTLQLSLFATGCSGIVSEFVLSTLATYLMGNATFQWTMIMSIMLFAMGVGSRYSRHFTAHLLDTFIFSEFLLSALCALSSVLAFGLSTQIESRELVIYPLAFSIGFLIGLEIPLVTRLNSTYQELRTNISSVLEMDYFGSLLGGILFAFVFLPFLGFVYTPILLGTINFIVASWLMWRFLELTHRKKYLISAFGLCLIILIAASFLARPMILYNEQKRYKDTIIYAKQTRYQKIVMTKWKSHYWLYINGQEQFSTYDEERYHEPLVHPAMQLTGARDHILVLGGGDGLAVREILKYPDVKSITLVDLDPVMTELAKTHPVLTKINRHAMTHDKVTVKNMDGAMFLTQTDRLFDVILIDLPDPDSMDIMHLYSLSFYRELKRHLTRQGVMVTQATSPYFSRKAFLSIFKTVQAANLVAIPLHNQVPTLGEWGWVLAMKPATHLSHDQSNLETELLQRVLDLSFKGIETRFINRDAVISMTHFGKGLFDNNQNIKLLPEKREIGKTENFHRKTPFLKNDIKINRQENPVLFKYYQQGAWEIY